MFAVVLFVGSAHAQRRAWGAGIVLEEPTGINAKA